MEDFHVMDAYHLKNTTNLTQIIALNFELQIQLAGYPLFTCVVC